MWLLKYRHYMAGLFCCILQFTFSVDIEREYWFKQQHIIFNGRCLPRLPPEIVHNHCFQIVTYIKIVQRKTEDNVYAHLFFQGGGKEAKQALLWEMWK